jgi:glycosyltransferase involved in cell wall biosynthesis
LAAKICHLTSVHKYTDTRIYLKECQSTVAEGYEIHLIAPEAPNRTLDGVHLHSVKKGLGNRFLRMTKTVSAVYKEAREVNADVYQFHDPELIPVGLLLKSKGKRVIYDVHEDVPRQILSKHWIPKVFRIVFSRLFELIENFAVKRFDGVVTATPFINKRFSSLCKNSVNVNNYPILSELKLPSLDWSRKERTVCYVGGITNIRGIFEMVEAVGLVNVKLLLGGSFSKENERTKTIQMDGWSSVDELGFLQRTQVVETYQRSMAGLVVLHPTRNYVDSLPVKMFEYLASGIPVIASDFPLWKDIIETNRCGICVDPLNPGEIAKAIQVIVEKPNEAKKMGINGKRAVEKKYNWELESKKLMTLYERISANLQ